MVSDHAIWASAENFIAKGHWLRKKSPIWELFFVLNMAIERGFNRVNSELIFLFFYYVNLSLKQIKLPILVICEPVLKSSLPADHIPRKKGPIWELFFVLNMAIGRSFDRINFEIISPVFDIVWWWPLK